MKNVIFKNIKMKNFKCHEDTSLNLVDNKFISISGKNGSGKTSYIDAIVYALYDCTTKDRRGDSVVRKKSKKNCSIILLFDIDNDKYRIENYRLHKKFNNKKFLYKNDIDISGSTVDETNQLISQLIMPKDLFLNSLLFSQFINRSFTDMTHSGQKEILDKILNFEKYDEYYNKFKEYEKKINTDLLNLNNECFQLTTSMTVLTQSYEKEQNLFDYRKQSLNFEINTINNDINISNDVIKNKYKFNENEYKNIINQLSQLDFEISNFDNKIKDENLKNNCNIEQLKTDYKNKFDTIKNKIDTDFIKQTESFKNNLNKLEKDYLKHDHNYLNLINNLEISIKNIESTLTNEFNIKKHELELKRTNINENILIKKSLINDLITEINNLDVQLLDKKIKNKKDLICPTCKQVVNDNFKINIDTYFKDLENIRNNKIELKNTHSAELIELNNNLNKCDNELKNLLIKHKKSIIENTKELQVQLNNLNAEKVKILDKILLDKINIENLLNEQTNKKTLEIEKEHVSLLNAFRDSEKILKNDFIKFQTNLQTEKENIILKRESLKDKIKTQEDIKKNYEEHIKLLEINKSKLINVEKETNILNMNFETYNIDYINNISNIKKSIENNENKQKDIKNTIEICGFWKTAFSDIGIKSILLDESIPILNKKAIELSEKINNLKIRFNSQKTLKSGDQRNKFSIEVIHSKNLSEFDDLSAGETKISNIIVLLCLRHLIEYMHNIKFNLLLLDEILDSLDQENSVIIIEMLKKLSDDYTILFITHTHRYWIEADHQIML